MKQIESELKKRLMEQAEAAIDKMLSEKKPAEEITLTDIEHLSRTTGEKVMQNITKELVSASEDSQDATLCCPDCGKQLHYKGQKEKPIVTGTGEAVVRRAYYYCSACRKGIFPPGSALEAGQ